MTPSECVGNPSDCVCTICVECYWIQCYTIQYYWISTHLGSSECFRMNSFKERMTSFLCIMITSEFIFILFDYIWMKLYDLKSPLYTQ